MKVSWTPGVLAVACVACLLCTACDDLSEFKTGPNHVFRGEVIGSDAQQGDSSFIRQGFVSHTQMELTFDPTLATLAGESDAGVDEDPKDGPGTLTTYVCAGGKTSCPKSERTSSPFDHARILPIKNLAHDTLSEYTFPGGGRIRNYIFGVRFTSVVPPASSPVQRHAMMFVSLMENGDIEVRVIGPSVLAPDGKSDLLSELFGVFVLKRHAK